MPTLKTILFSLTLFLSFRAFAQRDQMIEVSKKVIDLGVVDETLGSSTKKIVLKVSANSPSEFKIKFDYKYRFVYNAVEVYSAPSGSLGIMTHPSSSTNYVGSSRLLFDIAESTVSRGDDLELVVEISKPNKNSHGVKVVVNLKDTKGNVITGHKRLLGLLGRSYVVKAAECSEDAETSSM